MMYDKNKPHDFNSLMDNVCTELLMGEIYHERMGNEFRKNGLRGFGRWADSEACGDQKSRMTLEKLLCDRLGYHPKIDMYDAQDAASWTMAGAQALKQTLDMWHKREHEFIEVLNMAVKMAAMEDICIYKELICLLDEVQSEAMRVSMCMKRLDLAGWNGHDVGIVSMILHKHFEEHPHDQYVNINIG